MPNFRVIYVIYAYLFFLKNIVYLDGLVYLTIKCLELAYQNLICDYCRKSFRNSQELYISYAEIDIITAEYLKYKLGKKI